MKEILIVAALFYVKVTLPAAFPVQSAKQRHCSMTKIKIIERDLRNSNKCSIVAADFVPKILYKWDKTNCLCDSVRCSRTENSMLIFSLQNIIFLYFDEKF